MKTPGAGVETAALSLVDAKRRMDEARAHANAANELMFEALLLLDPDECFDIDSRLQAEYKLAQTERDSELAWKRYEKAIIRYNWEFEQARKLGVTML